MADPQVIRDDAGRPAFAVIRWQEYQRLTGGKVADDDLYDEALFDRAVDENEFSTSRYVSPYRIANLSQRSGSLVWCPH